LFAYSNRVIGNGFAQAFLQGLRGKHIALEDGRDMFYGTMNGHGMPAMGVTGKGKCAVSQRKTDPSMRYSKAIEHIGPNGHAKGACTSPDGYKFSPQPFAEWVVVVHFMKDLEWRHGSKSKSPGHKLRPGDRKSLTG